MTRTHNGEVICDTCSRHFCSKANLKRHLVTHQQRVVVCQACSYPCKNRNELQEHYRRKHKRAGTHKVICDTCSRQFSSKPQLKRHLVTHEQGVVVCQACNYRCKNRNVLQEHYRRKHKHAGTHNGEVICDTCSRHFCRKENLKRHLVTHEQGVVVCQACSYPCKNRNVLQEHYRRKHKRAGPETLVSERQCEHCMRICASQALLRLHVLRIHTDPTKKYQCDHCKRFYSTRNGVREHIAWSHLRAAGAYSGHECPCGRVFRTPSKLREHHARVHLQLQPPRDYVCGECGKAFMSNQILKRHMKSHSDKTYPCPECGHTFKSESYITVHHKLKHLHMTRAQIRAERKPKLVNMANKKKKNQRRKRRGTSEHVAEGNETLLIKIEESDDEAVQLLGTLADVKTE